MPKFLQMHVLYNCGELCIGAQQARNQCGYSRNDPIPLQLQREGGSPLSKWCHEPFHNALS